MFQLSKLIELFNSFWWLGQLHGLGKMVAWPSDMLFFFFYMAPGEMLQVCHLILKFIAPKAFKTCCCHEQNMNRSKYANSTKRVVLWSSSFGRIIVAEKKRNEVLYLTPSRRKQSVFFSCLLGIFFIYVAGDMSKIWKSGLQGWAILSLVLFQIKFRKRLVL